MFTIILLPEKIEDTGTRTKDLLIQIQNLDQRTRGFRASPAGARSRLRPHDQRAEQVGGETVPELRQGKRSNFELKIIFFQIGKLHLIYGII